MSEFQAEDVSTIDTNLIPSKAEQDNSGLRAAIYARTSRIKPGFHYSIDEQVTRCWDWCEQQGWTVVFVFTDVGESGKDTDRSGFQNMLERAEMKCIDVVVFWKLDRFARSLTDLVRTEEELSQHGVALQSVTEYIDTASPVGRFTFRNLASAAELESDLTSQRVRIGIHGMAKENRWPNSQPPIGYNLADDQRLEINHKEAQLVRQIYELYLVYRSMPDVAFELNERGITTKQGNEWCRGSIKKILSNELYCGRYRLGEYEDTVEEYRILSDQLFAEVTDARYRFQHQKGVMDASRKRSKSEQILNEFRANRGGLA